MLQMQKCLSGIQCAQAKMSSVTLNVVVILAAEKKAVVIVLLMLQCILKPQGECVCW